MAKLGVQLSDAQAEQQQGRETRKDRVARQQGLERAERERIKFENLKAKAKEIQETKFVDRVDQEQYTYQVPDWDRINKNKHLGITINKYNRNPNRYLAILQKHGYTKSATGTRDKIVKFTLEDVEGKADNSYYDVYNDLSPDLKQFFSTPDQVLKDKATRIETVKGQIGLKQTDTDRRIAELRIKYADKIARREAWWDRKSDKYQDYENSKGVRTRYNSYKKSLRGYEDELDEKIAELQGFKKGLSKGLGQLNANVDADYKSIEDYAWDLGNYESSREQARNENKSNFYDKARAGELDDVLSKLGMDKSKLNYSKYKSGVKDYNKKVTIQQNLIAKGERIGFDKLSKAEQIKVNPDLAQWQWENKGEKLLFKGNTAIGVESASLKQSMSLTNYQTVTSPDYLKAQHNKKFAPKPVWDFAGGGGFQSKGISSNVFGSTKGKYDVNFKVLTAGKELPYGYGSQGTSQVDAQGNFKTPTVLMDRNQYNAITEKNKDRSFIGDVVGGVVTANKYLADRVQWDFSVTGSPSMPKVNLISFGKKDTVAEQYANVPSEYLDKQSGKLDVAFAGKENIDKLDTNLQTKYSGQYQNEFERKYGIALIDGTTDFDTASGQFKDSAEAGAINKNYGAEYETEYKKLLGSGTGFGDKGYLRKLGYGTGGFGLDIAKLGATAVSNPLYLAETGLAVYGGVAVLGATPPLVMNSAMAGLGVYGTYKFLDPKSTFTEAGAGLVTAGLSFGTLGVAGVKHLKSPHIKVIKIKAPKMNLKVAKGMKIGRDYNIVKDGVTGANKVVYKAQKLSQVGRAGSRTEVTTKWRHYVNSFNKKLKFDHRIKAQIGKGHGMFNTKVKFDLLKPKANAGLKPVTRGLPSDMIAKYEESASGWQRLLYGKDNSLGLMKVKVAPSNYQKATSLLKKYGWTDAQAKSVLRYSAPRVYEQWLSKGVINIKSGAISEKDLMKGILRTKGDVATAHFEHLTKRPVITVDKNLGIKTRGGADYLTKTDSVRKLMQDPTSKQFYAQYSNVETSGFINKAGNYKGYGSIKYTTGKTISKATDLQKGYEHLGRVKGFDVYDEKALFKDMIGISKDNTLVVKVARTRAGNINMDINLDPTKVKPQISHQRLYKKIIDLDKGKNVWVKPTNIKKTAWPKYNKPIVKKPTVYAQPKQSNIVKEIMKKIDKVDDYKAIGGSQSKYYGGKGGAGGINIGDPQKMFDGSGRVRQLVMQHAGEDNVGALMLKQNVLSPQSIVQQNFLNPQALTQNQILQNQHLLKTINAPQMKIGVLNKLNVNVNQVKHLNLIKLNSLTTTIGLKALMKQNLYLNNTVKIDTLVNHKLNYHQLMNVKTVAQVKTAPLLKSQLKGMLDFGVGVPSLATPTYKAPKIPKINNPYIPKPFQLPRLIDQIKKKKGKGGNKGFNELAYLPDFTSRALGLGAETVTQKQASKKLKKLLTGLEIRRGVKIKG